MSVAIRAITRIVDADDAPALGAGQNGYALTWDNASGAFVATALFTGGLLATGATTGATSQAQTFTNGIVGPSWKPSANSTTALQLQNAAGTPIVTIDTTNGTLSVPGSGEDSLRIGTGTLAASGSTAVGVLASANNASGGCTALGKGSNASGTFSSAFGNNSTAGGDRSIAFGMNSSATGNTGLAIGFAANASNTNSMAFGRQATTTKNNQTIFGNVLYPVNEVLVVGKTALTSTVQNMLILSHDTSGTAAAGFGAGQLFQLQSSTTAAQSAARIQALWYEATHATFKADLVGTAYDAGGEREGWRVRGAGSAPAIGFLGATPAARLAHVADASTTHAITDPGDAPADADALRDDLVTNVIPTIETALNNLGTKINSLLTMAETFGFHATS